MKYKKIKIMPDFNSSGIWDKTGDGMMVEYKELGIPKNLQKEFEEWIDFYDQKCHEHQHYVFKPELAEEMNAKGRELARKFKSLRPDLTVIYVGENSNGILEEEEITDA